MMIRCLFPALMGATALSLWPGTPTPARAQVALTPVEVQAGLDTLVHAGAAPGVILLVYRDERLLYRARAGDIDSDRPLPVASASKWMAAALLMMLVDDGLLSLDGPISEHLPELAGGADDITLRQLLSYTAGQGGLTEFADLRLSPDISLREAARQIAAQPRRDAPGSVFRYGGPSFQIAGALAETVTGRSWGDLFDERLARPLGLRQTTWGAVTRAGVRPGVPNPNLQAGLVTTADDYGRFLGLIANDGVMQGRRLLSSGAIAALTSAATLDTRMAFTPPGLGETPVQYALGAWCEAHDADGRCTTLSSPGARGAYPWIDRDTGLYGVFLMTSRLPRVQPHIQRTRDAVRACAGSREPELPTATPRSSADQADPPRGPAPCAPGRPS
ncbi:serine hydrolase domain-containing protein [Brevundimonas diminuta]|uniref:Beta-lactamase-related domain-containing protein n=1 Tax=Brevundimonas diminuta TaxID=293 RepID=A0A1Z3LVS6_BREDI|nr:serine hydrolase domain-containing protein [Brevundimonas diminuta]ASD26239.1 hypothetical protein CD943_04640 [Brevundimonas diminuta]